MFLPRTKVICGNVLTLANYQKWSKYSHFFLDER